jgi:hypothetical protein
MLRYAVCSIALLIVIWLTRHMLLAAFDELGFGPGVLVGVTFCAVIVALAFGWDRYERNRSRESQR